MYDYMTCPLVHSFLNGKFAQQYSCDIYRPKFQQNHKKVAKSAPQSFALKLFFKNISDTRKPF